MNHINLNSQAEAVKKFFRSLSVGSEGAVLELNGRVLARLMPVTEKVDRQLVDEEWTDAKNDRRCELIDRKYDGGLDPSEEAELAVLQEAMNRHVDRVAPLPLAATRKLHQQLLRKATKARARKQA